MENESYFCEILLNREDFSIVGILKSSYPYSQITQKDLEVKINVNQAISIDEIVLLVNQSCVIIISDNDLSFIEIYVNRLDDIYYYKYSSDEIMDEALFYLDYINDFSLENDAEWLSIFSSNKELIYEKIKGRIQSEHDID